MQKNNYSFRDRIINQMRNTFKDPLITQLHTQERAEQTVYTVKEEITLDIARVRHFVENSRKMSNEQISSIVKTIYSYIVHLLAVLENNQRCRLNWQAGIVRGRVQRQNKINLKPIQNQKVMLVRLIEQCKHCVSSKSQLLSFISSKKKEIFQQVGTEGLIKNVKQVYLLEKYQRYSLIEEISEERYLQLYDWVLQKILSYHNFFKAYMENKVSLNQLHRKCCGLLQKDQVILNASEIPKLIKFTLTLSLNQVKKIKKLASSVLILKKSLIQAVMQAYYLSFLMKGDIHKMQDTLRKVQQTSLEQIKSVKLSTPKVSFLDYFDQSLINQMENKMNLVQFQFNKIYKFLDNSKGYVFIKLYNRKYNKRMISLTKIEDSLTSMYKMLNNSDFAQFIWLQEQKRTRLQKRNAAIQQKWKQLVSLKKEIKVLNQMHFKLIFEQIQRLSIFVHQEQGYSHWNNCLIDFQTNLINQCLFDSNGKRVKKQKSLTPKMSRSRTIYNINRQDVFGQTILEIIDKSESLHASRVHNQEQFDKYAVVKEAKDYLQNLSIDLGQTLLDQHNFQAHVLPKLIRKLQKALELTPYSQQPLNLQISQMLQSLKLLPYVIRTQINEKKLNLIVYPKPNVALMNELKDILFSTQETLIKVCSQINNNPIRKKAIHQKILSFLESRLKFTFDFMGQLQQLNRMIQVMDQSIVVKESYDISQQSTYSIILKLLLVQKQLTAYLQQNKDLKVNEQISKSAVKLINEQFYAYLIKSCSFLFQKDKNLFNPNLLENLLHLCEDSKSYTAQSNQLIDLILNFFEKSKFNKLSFTFSQQIAQFTKKLNQLFFKLQHLYLQARKYYPTINSQQLKYHLLRLQQFMIVLRQGSQTKLEIFDPNSVRLLKLLQDIDFLFLRC